MKDLIDWLREVEHIAGDVYLMAASAFEDDLKLSNFLRRTAEDEAWHYHAMGSALALLPQEPPLVPAISIDKDTKEKIFNQFYDIKNGIEKLTLSRDELLKKILTVELSEWNDIFLYVVNTLRKITGEFNYPAARMQAHLKGIAHYIEDTLGNHDLLHEINVLEPVWTENILVVDDMPAVANLVKNLLNRDGHIDLADNGESALELINKNYYKLIISDMVMPGMDGITLFRGAVKKYPTIKSRFLFMTGNPSDDRICQLNEQKVQCLKKPFNIKALREEAYKILLSK